MSMQPMGKQFLWIHALALLAASASTPPLYASPSSELVVFAYKDEAPPVSFSHNGGVAGFCKELADHLSSNGFNIEERPFQNYSERFKALKNIEPKVSNENLPALECGPTTITRKREEELKLAYGKNEYFSRPFFVTGTKLLIKNSKLPEVYKGSTASDFVIGTMSGTTSFDVIRHAFPAATIDEKVEDRAEARDRLTGKKGSKAIDAYAGDEVLLSEILLDLSKEGKGSEFSIIPRFHSYSKEEYAIVVYNSKQLLDSVNEWIQSEEGRKASKKLKQSNMIDDITSEIIESKHYNLFALVFTGLFLALLATNPFFLCLVRRVTPAPVRKLLRLKEGANTDYTRPFAGAPSRQIGPLPTEKYFLDPRNTNGKSFGGEVRGKYMEITIAQIVENCNNWIFESARKSLVFLRIIQR